MLCSPVSEAQGEALDPGGDPGAGEASLAPSLPFPQAVRLSLRLPAPLGAGGLVPAKAGCDQASPAGLPVPGQGPCGAAATGGRPHRGP